MRCLDSSIRAARTPLRLDLGDHITEDEKIRRLAIVQEKQRAIQIRRHADLLGTIEEAFTEGYNQATGQWIGRTTQNRTLNFVHPQLRLRARVLRSPARRGTFALPARVRIL